MTLWVFGDSFAHQHKNLKDQWMQRVANILETDIHCFGLVGSSAEFTYFRFNDIRNNIKNNDVVIVALTTTSRRWFFRNHPEHTALPDTNNLGYTSTHTSPSDDLNENEALEYYSKFLNNGEIELQHLYNFLYNLDYQTQKLNLHTIVLINFYDTEQYLKDKTHLWPNIAFSHDKTLVPSMDEFAKDFFERFDFSKGIKDVRVNHLIKDNHIILSDKIIDNIRYNKPIDLSKGFHKHIITIERLDDKDWMNEQTFNFITLTS